MHYTYEPECPEAVLAFYQRGKERRVRVTVDEMVVADLVHDGTMHMLLDRKLLAQGLIRLESFHFDGPQRLVAKLHRRN